MTPSLKVNNTAWKRSMVFGFSLDHHIATKLYIEHVCIHIWNRADIKEMNYAGGPGGLRANVNFLCGCWLTTNVGQLIDLKRKDYHTQPAAPSVIRNLKHQPFAGRLCVCPRILVPITPRGWVA